MLRKGSLCDQELIVINMGKPIDFHAFGIGICCIDRLARLVLVRAVDRQLNLHPQVNPTLVVDDLAADMIAPGKHIVKELGGFIQGIAEFIEQTGQELSATKSVCTASTKQVGGDLAKRLQAWNSQFKPRVKALGVGLGAGVRRNIGVLKARLVS